MGTLQEELYAKWAGPEQLWRESLVFVRSAEDIEDEECDGGGIKRQWLSQFEFSKLFTASPEPAFLSWLALTHRMSAMEKGRCHLCCVCQLSPFTSPASLVSPPPPTPHSGASCSLRHLHQKANSVIPVSPHMVITMATLSPHGGFHGYTVPTWWFPWLHCPHMVVSSVSRCPLCFHRYQCTQCSNFNLCQVSHFKS